MPLDQATAEAMIGTFRNMAKEITDKGHTGEDVDKMKIALFRMEELSQQCNDISEFSGLLMQENLYMKFSDYYSRVLSNAAKEQYQVNATTYDETADNKLLQQTLKAYRDAINRLRDAKKENIKQHGEKASQVFFNDEALIKPIENVIQLGESGYTYPKFLKLMIENGMDKAMEGSIVSKDSIVYSKSFYEAAKINPHYEKREIAFLDKWDELSAKAKFGIASVFKYNLACEVINAEIDPQIERWEKTKSYWENVLSLLCDWAMAHMSFAHQIEPWAQAPNPRAAVQETIDCEPGKLEIRLTQIQKYFELSFNDIFKHETFLWDVQWQHLWYSQEFTTFMRDEVFRFCKPGNRMPSELSTKMEKIYNEKRMRNPDQNKINERYRDNHNKYFGEGDFEKKYGMPKPYVCNAKSWTLETF